MRRALLPLFALLAACSSGSQEYPLAGRSELDFTEVAPLDCQSECPGVRVAGSVDGAFSADRTGSVWFDQNEACSSVAPDPQQGFHSLRVGDECRLSSSSDLPGGAFACELFACGETGTYFASACILPPKDTGGTTQATPTCAEKTVACALAVEANRQMRMRGTSSAQKVLCR